MRLTKKELQAAIEALSMRLAGEIDHEDGNGVHPADVYQAAQDKLLKQLKRRATWK